MPLQNLNPKTALVDYSDTDELIYKDCPTILSHAYFAGKALVDSKITENENIDESKIKGMLKSIVKDQEVLAAEYEDIRKMYEKGKEENKLVASSDWHMFQLEVGQKAQEWVGTYNDTVLSTLNDLTEYVNSILPDNEKIPEMPELQSVDGIKEQHNEIVEQLLEGDKND